MSESSVATLRPVRVAYLVTHPIQYQAPLLKEIAACPDIALKVFFQTDMSTKTFFDEGFGRTIEWDVPLLGGYNYEFLPNAQSEPVVGYWRPWNRGLLRRLREGRFDALWVHGYARPYNIWIMLAASTLLGLKVLVRDEATAVSAVRRPLREMGKTLMMRSLVLLGARFLAIGSLNAAYYRRLGVPANRIFLMPYCVDNAFFQGRAKLATPDREVFRKELGLSSGVPVILYASKFSRRKKPDDMIAAHRRIRAQLPADRVPYLLMVGDGEMRQALQDEAADDERIRFLGFRNQTELPRFFDLCDVFVLPSVHEPWGLVVNEAMNAGKAVIVTTEVGCGPDLVRDGENGFIIPTEDPAELADRLLEIIAVPGRTEAMGAASLERVNRWNFDMGIDGLRAALAG